MNGNALSEAGGPNVVLGHDWLTGMRGGERVLELLCAAFPHAPLVSLLGQPETVSAIIRERPLQFSRLQRIPGITRRYRHLLPLMPLAASRLRVPPCDLLLTTSHCVAKSFRPPPGARHLCYCFTPMRYAWLFGREYLGPTKALLAAPLLGWLRRWDARTANRVDRFVAISRHVRGRIERFYGREADVVYPPVDIVRCTPTPGRGASPAEGRFDLIVSALAPYKRIDLAVRAYSRLGWPLKVVGTGTETAALQAMAADNIEFLGWRSDADVLALYRSCRLLIFPGEEDFGIVPLEAMACGRPVVAYARGGALETVEDGHTGVLFVEQQEACLLDAVSRAAVARWDVGMIRAHAERFGTDRFVVELARCVSRTLRHDSASPVGRDRT